VIAASYRTGPTDADAVA